MSIYQSLVKIKVYTFAYINFKQKSGTVQVLGEQTLKIWQRGGKKTFGVV